MDTKESEKDQTTFWRNILIGFVAFIVYIAAMDSRLCRDDNIDIKLIDSSKESKNNDYTKQQTREEHSYSYGFAFRSAIDIYLNPKETRSIEDARAKLEHSSEQKHNSWIEKFLCDFKISDAIIGFFTYCLVIVTWALARITKKLWDAGERQIKTSRSVAASQARQTRDAIKEARRSADAAMAALGSDRAWLVPAPDKIGFAVYEDSTVDGVFYKKTLAISVNWVNKGKSPAIHTAIRACHKIASKDDATIPLFNIDIEDEARCGIIGPDSYGASRDTILTEEHFRGVFSKQEVIYIYSKTAYTDIYNSTIVRESETCYQIAYPGDKIVNGKSMPNWQIFQVGPQNSAK
jgi:hypothetical protein